MPSHRSESAATETSRRSFPWAAARCALFFALYFAWMWRGVDLRLFHEVGPLFPPFLTGASFRADFLTHPGGLAEYAAALLSQSYASSALGALVVTALAFLSWLGTDVLMRALGGERLRAAAFGPPVLYLATLTGFDARLVALIGPTAALVCAALYVGLAERGSAVRAIALVTLSVALYYVVGAPYILFAALAAIYELLRGRRLLVLTSLLGAEAIPYLIGVYALAGTAGDAFLGGLTIPVRTGPRAAALVGVYPFVLVSVAAAVLMRGRWPQRKEPAKAPSPRARLGLVVGLLWPAAVGAALVSLSRDAVGVRVLRVGYLARHHDWPAVLSGVRRLPRDAWNVVTSHEVNRALYETGKLPYAMFSFPQGPETLMVDMDYSGDVAAQEQQVEFRKDAFSQIDDLDLQLGLVNEAEQEGHEALTVHGPHPVILQQLALVNTVKQQPEAARAFVAAMSRCLVPSPKAAGIAAYLARRPAPAMQAEIERLRSVMLLRDEARPAHSIEARCRTLLARNPRNRMAFEYLMAYYLLTRQVDRLAGEMHRLRGFDYPDLPRHYEEAVILYQSRTRHPVDCGGRRVSSQALDDYVGFTGTVGPRLAAGDAMGARAAAGPRYGNTFFYYYVFGESGVGAR